MLFRSGDQAAQDPVEQDPAQVDGAEGVRQRLGDGDLGDEHRAILRDRAHGAPAFTVTRTLPAISHPDCDALGVPLAALRRNLVPEPPRYTLHIFGYRGIPKFVMPTVYDVFSQF